MCLVLKFEAIKSLFEMSVVISPSAWWENWSLSAGMWADFYDSRTYFHQATHVVPWLLDRAALI